MIVEAIRKAAKSGLAGDGKIVILNLEKLYRIRIGEEGIKAI